MAVAAIAAGLALPAPALANTITVNSTADTLVTNGTCSIREAIINANNDAATWPDCAAGAGADTIVLPAGTITFAIPNPVSSPCCLDSDQQSAWGDLDILSSMTIVGNPAGTVIDGNQFDRIFDINPDVDGLPETVTPVIAVQIHNLTMTNARQNQSGGIRIQARATVAMDRCTVSNSTSWADDGGGIYLFTDGALTLTNSTISGNHALIMGGGIRSDGLLSIVNSTITGNDTGGVFGNLAQGLMCGAPACTLRNSIVAGNGAAPRGDIGGTITSLGYNIIGKTTNNLGEVIAVITATTGDQFDTGAAAVDLQALANNGGPTPTHALGAASIAIDKGESSLAITDQRGEPRPCDLATVADAAGGDGADIGAFEVQGVCVAPNAAPDAVDDAATFEVNSGLHIIAVLTNDTDPDSDALTITAVTQGAHGSVVNNGISVSYTPNANFLGTDTFTYTIDDGHSHTDTATVTVTVVDTIPPVVTPPANITVTAGASCTATVNPGTATATDNGGVPAVQGVRSDGQPLNAPYPIGTTTIVWTATDGGGNSTSASQTIVVNPPPLVISGASATPSVLWPPNNKMVKVTINYTVNNCGGVTCVIDKITTNDHENGHHNGHGQGHHNDDHQHGHHDNDDCDWQIIDAHHVKLRAEKGDGHDDRVYTIHITCVDAFGQKATKKVTVTVPHHH